MKSVLLSVQPKWCEKIIHIIGQKGTKPIYEKSVEIRKTRPKLETPFKCYIYCTKPKELFDLSYDVQFGKVIGEFVCDWIESTPLWRLKGNTGFCAKRTEREEKLPEMACLSLDEIYRYIINENRLIHGWHISNLIIYDEPKELGEFKTLCTKNTDCYLCDRYDHIRKDCNSTITRPPQSWCYVEELRCNYDR